MCNKYNKVIHDWFEFAGEYLLLDYCSAGARRRELFNDESPVYAFSIKKDEARIEIAVKKEGKYQVNYFYINVKPASFFNDSLTNNGLKLERDIDKIFEVIDCLDNPKNIDVPIFTTDFYGGMNSKVFLCKEEMKSELYRIKDIYV